MKYYTTLENFTTTIPLTQSQQSLTDLLLQHRYTGTGTKEDIQDITSVNSLFLPQYSITDGIALYQQVLNNPIITPVSPVMSSGSYAIKLNKKNTIQFITKLHSLGNEDSNVATRNSMRKSLFHSMK
jgi:hypothetical protein